MLSTWSRKGEPAPSSPRAQSDSAFVESPGDMEADVIRAVVVDEELLEECAAGSTAALEQPSSTAPDWATTAGLTATHVETLKLLLSGGVAGAFSKSCTAPLARLTILYQINGLQAAGATAAGAPRLGVWAAMQQVARTEGLRALWKGNGVTIIHRLPYSAANFWMYEQVNEVWKRYLPPTRASTGGDAVDVARRLASGGVAGMSACALAYPLDLVRTRLAAQTQQRYYRGIGHALATIVRDEGTLGLYRGMGATLLQVGPSLAINYAAYETLRSRWLAATDRDTPSVAMSLACGSAASIVSSTFTFPLDLVRRRLQLVARNGGNGSRVAGFGASTYRGVLREVWAKEGLRGLYAGILPEYYKVAPGCAIAFCIYEVMKSTLGVTTNATGR